MGDSARAGQLCHIGPLRCQWISGQIAGDMITKAPLDGLNITFRDIFGRSPLMQLLAQIIGKTINILDQLVGGLL